MKADKLSQLNETYHTRGFKHLEEWINSQIEEALLKIKNPSTPVEEVNIHRMTINAYERLMDKVEQDKLAYTSRENSK